MIKVLMTGAGAPGAAGIISCLSQSNNIELFTADANESASGKFLSHNFTVIPKADAPEFIQEIEELCAKHEINVIFPLVTRELFKLAEVKEKFLRNGVKVIVSDYSDLTIANNKSSLYKHLAEHNVALPKFRVVSDFEILKKAFSELGYPKEPLCIKPSVSNGSRGVRIIDDSVDRYDLLFNHKPNSLYMRYEELLATLEGTAFPELLVSEYLPGEEITIDTIIDNNHKMVLCLPRRRDVMSGGISMRGQFVYNEQVVEYVRQVVESLKLVGPIGVQVKKDVNGDYKILEINPRIQGTSVAALGLNINLPLLAIGEIMQFENLSIPKMDEISWGRSFVRVYKEIYY